MNSKVDSHPGARNKARQRQGEELHNKEPELQRLAAERNPEFFKQILPFVRPLKTYIKRRLRAAYLDERIRTQMATSGDILDDVIEEAFENFSRKPEGVTLEQWLYQIANHKIDDYIAKAESWEKRRRSLETLAQSELRTLDEMPITADAEGEPWLPEDLDDSEYQPRDFTAPADPDTPEQQLERKEELRQILWALAHVPEQERLVFELYAVEGFSKDEVAEILNVSAAQVPQIVERVKEQVRKQLGAQRGEGTIAERKAS
jgi:RNA polymerase sigma factor (sigma-70 family)